MHRLIDFSLRNKFLILILTVVLAGIGVVYARRRRTA